MLNLVTSTYIVNGQDLVMTRRLHHIELTMGSWTDTITFGISDNYKRIAAVEICHRVIENFDANNVNHISLRMKITQAIRQFMNEL